MQRRSLLGLALALAAPAAVAASRPAELAPWLPSARLQGEARLRYFGLHVYDIRLWATDPVGADAWPRMPLALELSYARTLEGRAIAERSLQEMRRQGEIPEPVAARWLGTMQTLFPDVGDGDRLTGLHRPGDGVRFFHNGQARGELRDADFAQRFFGIWLAPQTSEPALRAQLLGLTR